LAQLTQIDYARDPDYTKAEFAILVRSDLKGYGLGWQLMTHLIRYANTVKAPGASRLGADGKREHAEDVPRAWVCH
jgi:hypothetical protein